MIVFASEFVLHAIDFASNARRQGFDLSSLLLAVWVVLSVVQLDVNFRRQFRLEVMFKERPVFGSLAWD